MPPPTYQVRSLLQEFLEKHLRNYRALENPLLKGIADNPKAFFHGTPKNFSPEEIKTLPGVGGAFQSVPTPNTALGAHLAADPRVATKFAPPSSTKPSFVHAYEILGAKNPLTFPREDDLLTAIWRTQAPKFLDNKAVRRIYNTGAGNPEDESRGMKRTNLLRNLQHGAGADVWEDMSRGFVQDNLHRLPIIYGNDVEGYKGNPGYIVPFPQMLRHLGSAQQDSIHTGGQMHDLPSEVSVRKFLEAIQDWDASTTAEDILRKRGRDHKKMLRKILAGVD